MAVYTRVPAEEMAAFLTRFDIGALKSAKGIAEGVENSNYLIETDAGRFILTLYEKRVNASDLPFFMALIDHLADAGCPVPRAVKDRGGEVIHQLCGRPACLIEFVPGISVDRPSTAAAHSAGKAMGQMHRALADFPLERRNSLSLPDWHRLANEMGSALDDIAPGLARRVEDELAFLTENWPQDLPRSVIHADLFPDNVLLLGDNVTGIIDFYFASTDIRAYDLAVMHSAWCFDPAGDSFDADVSDALQSGYTSALELSEGERMAMSILARGAALRFLLTRAFDWLNTPADALVTRKDPLAYLKRLDFYASAAAKDIFAR